MTVTWADIALFGGAAVVGSLIVNVTFDYFRRR